MIPKETITIKLTLYQAAIISQAMDGYVADLECLVHHSDISSDRESIEQYTAAVGTLDSCKTIRQQIDRQTGII